MRGVDEAKVSGMPYDDFKRMVAFLCGVENAHSQYPKDEMVLQALSDVQTMEYICLLFDNDKSRMISPAEIMACVMPQSLFRDKALRAKEKQKRAHAAQRELEEARQLKQKEEQPRYVEHEGLRSGEVEGGANTMFVPGGTSNRGLAEKEDFEDDESEVVQDLLGGKEGN